MSSPPLDCSQVRLLLGVSALGLTEPEEERVVEDHCRDCVDCAAERAEIAGIVPLLGTVDAEDATADLPEPRPELLRRLIASTQAEDRLAAAQRRWRLSAGVALAGMAAAGALLVVAPWRDDPAEPGRSAQTFTAQAFDAGTGVHGTFKVASTDTGSRLWMDLSGVRAGDRCRLVVQSVSGERQVAASWVVDYEGSATLAGHTSWQEADIAALKVVDQHGKVLLSVSQANFSATA